MNQMIHAIQALITDKDMWEPGATDGTREQASSEHQPEGVGGAEQEEDSMQLHRRRRARRAAGGSIAGMMAAKRVAQQRGVVETTNRTD